MLESLGFKEYTLSLIRVSIILEGIFLNYKGSWRFWEPEPKPQNPKPKNPNPQNPKPQDPNTQKP